MCRSTGRGGRDCALAVSSAPGSPLQSGPPRHKVARPSASLSCTAREAPPLRARRMSMVQPDTVSSANSRWTPTLPSCGQCTHQKCSSPVQGKASDTRKPPTESSVPCSDASRTTSCGRPGSSATPPRGASRPRGSTAPHSRPAQELPRPQPLVSTTPVRLAAVGERTAKVTRPPAHAPSGPGARAQQTAASAWLPANVSLPDRRTGQCARM
mmetsp:Transcript_107058/g.302742  ORF Transcript_107058/g.302742 Transcript_107058/m.302742 type:complete len:212 (-) Transcript_107058:288-923(-)